MGHQGRGVALGGVALMKQHYTFVSPEEHNGGVRYACLEEVEASRCLLPRYHSGPHESPTGMTLEYVIGVDRAAAVTPAKKKRVCARRGR